jgi:hypothetical protein
MAGTANLVLVTSHVLLQHTAVNLSLLLTVLKNDGNFTFVSQAHVTYNQKHTVHLCISKFCNLSKLRGSNQQLTSQK